MDKVDTDIRSHHEICKSYQLQQQRQSRFKFLIRDDASFNYSVYVYVHHIDGHVVLYVVDENTKCSAARGLTSEKAGVVLSALRSCWIDVHLAPLT